MKARLRWCISMLEPTSIPDDPMFRGMLDIVYIDEKWFDLTKRKENYHLHPLEQEPLRTVKSKNFIRQIMFLTTVARPRVDGEGNYTFDGKIGTFALANYEPARRTSVNRVVGTLEMKPINSIKKEVIRTFLIEKVLLAIRAKWPSEDVGILIFIKQDNAPTHIDPSDPLFCEVAKQDGFDIRLMCQPPNSPDLNILDLGFFRAIQSLRYKKAAKSVTELVSRVEEALEEFPSAMSIVHVRLCSHTCQKL